MDNLQVIEQEKTVLRWGGLAGILGGILFILAMIVVVMGPAGEDPADLAGWVTRFPDIKAARILENIVYLIALILAVPLYLALYRALRRTSLAPALFGSVLGILGLTAMIISATPHVAHHPISDLYHMPGATPADQAALALMWQATRGVLDAMLYVGFLVVSIGSILLSVGMLGTPAFGKGWGGAGLVIGVVGFITAVLQMIDPPSMIGAASYFTIILFCLVLGWKVYRESKDSQEI